MSIYCVLGKAGSGKTTWIKSNFKSYNSFDISHHQFFTYRHYNRIPAVLEYSDIHLIKPVHRANINKFIYLSSMNDRIYDRIPEHFKELHQRNRYSAIVYDRKDDLYSYYEDSLCKLYNLSFHLHLQYDEIFDPTLYITISSFIADDFQITFE